MPMTRAEKETKIAEISERLGSSSAVYLTDLTGMSVEILTGFRRRCRDKGVTIEVVKNTLIERAAQSTQYELLAPHLNGPTAVLTSTEDVVAPARVLDQFIRENKLPKIKVACIEGKIYSDTAIQELAKLPSREVLLSQLLSALNGPLTQFVSVLNANLRNLAHVLDEVAKKKGE